MQSILGEGNCLVATLIAGLVILQFFQNCFPRISMGFSNVCFLVFGAVIFL